MGKKLFNAKARRNPRTIVDNSTVQSIHLELDDDIAGAGGYDEANALVLPSQKRQTKIKVEKRQNVKILTKKQRKALQAIVDKKKKKEGRSGLLEKLAAVQIPEEELQQYTSISQVQTVGLKKLPTLDEYLARKQEKQVQLASQASAQIGVRVSSIRGAAKRKLLSEERAEIEAKRRDPNFLGLDEDDGDDDSCSDDDNDSNDGSCDDDDNNGNNIEDINVNKDNEKKSTNTKSSQTEQSASTSKHAESVLQAKLLPKTTPKPAGSVTTHVTVYVPVHRTSEVQASRLKLPILAEEQQIMETINENQITIIAGETGSGKTTQLPQFLYEAGYAQNKMIGITEPRRVAAIAMSRRVAHEMNLTEAEVSYLIRFEGNVTPATRIKFMTDGVLLKEIESDFLLSKYAVIILDEAHERSVYTDILVGLLSRIVPLRNKRGNPLKLIIMSATLRVADFTDNARLFKTPPPLLKVEARQYPVTIHFQKRTPKDYVAEAYSKAVKIHSRLPEGGILIFVTGQQEVNQLVRKLRHTFPYDKQRERKNDDSGKASVRSDALDDDAQQNKSNNDTDADADDATEAEFDLRRAIRRVRKSKKKFLAQMSLHKINLDDYRLPGDDTEADLHESVNSTDNCATDAEDVSGELDVDDADANADDDANDGDDNDDDDDDMLATVYTPTTSQPLWVLPLYSLLSTERQNRIFQTPPSGCRLCVVSTNVAETSLTIPNIKYVVDSGRQKTRLYDKITGVSAFVVTYTSKASADQRAGRAGRVSAGHCYRLYSSAVYNDQFDDFSIPDIQKKPVDDLMLQMRCMGIDRVVNFPFPSPPDAVQLQAAEQRLTILGALERCNPPPANGKDFPPKVTKLGQVAVRFPVAPRFGKMLALSHQQDLLPYTVCLVAALSVQEILMEVGVDRDTDLAPTANKWRLKRRSWAGTGNYQLLGDPMVLLRAVGAAEFAGSLGKLSQFCAENGLRMKAMMEVRKLRNQLTNDINLNINDVNICVDPAMAPPTDAQARFLRQILLAGMGDRVAHKVDLVDTSDKEERRRLKYAYHCLDMVEPVFLHESSVLKHKVPEWIVYQEAYEVQNGDSTKMFIRGITAIEPEWLLLYVPLLCNILKVCEDPAPRYSQAEGKIYSYVDATFGKAAWQLPLAEVLMPLSDQACSYFGMFLLDGIVCPKLAEYKLKLKSTPASLIKSWSNLNENVQRFKRALIGRQIYTRAALQAQWTQDANFLLTEYQNLLYDVSVSELTAIWPPACAH